MIAVYICGAILLVAQWLLFVWLTNELKEIKETRLLWDRDLKNEWRDCIISINDAVRKLIANNEKAVSLAKKKRAKK